MKNLNFAFSRSPIWILLPAMIFIQSCVSTQKWELPADLVGNWKSEEVKITVRTSPKWMKFEFYSDSATIAVKINGDKTASGYIGEAKFANGKIVKNGGNPDRTGVAYIIRCGSIGKIYPKDPLDSKEVEIWMGPNDRGMDSELRFTENGAQFPMADLKLLKEL